MICHNLYKFWKDYLSLEFKKLDATNIAGVMHNPAIADLNMNTFNIFTVDI